MVWDRFRNSGWYFSVLKWTAEKGVSFEVRGLLCDLSTPGLAHQGGGLGFSWGAAICMERQLVGRHGMFCHGAFQECLEWHFPQARRAGRPRGG